MKKTLLAAAAFAVSASSSALEVNFDEKYISASITKASYGSESPNMGFSIALGAPVEDFDQIEDTKLFVEAGYANLGKYSESETFNDGFGAYTAKAELTATSLFAAARLKKDFQDGLSGFAKLGLNRFTGEASISVDGFSSSNSESEFKLLYGAGVEYIFKENINLTAEYISYEADTTAFTVGLNYSFD